MADLKEVEAQQPGSTPAAAPETPKKEEKPAKARKPKARVAGAPRAKGNKTKKVSPSVAAASPAVSTSVRKTYSRQERAQKLGEIQKLIGAGESVKAATRKAGISEQTYYQWKKPGAPKASSNELSDLAKLEAENTRLKKLLAERLQKENAELKKKLAT